ncbi:DMT family transporter [Streptomyces violascens]|uniref:DMT family transporter n=1 Tax=Streptomyces violascens TaxID=67381 RepID=UPI003688B79B
MRAPGGAPSTRSTRGRWGYVRPTGTGLHPPTAGDWLVLAAAVARAVHVTVMHRKSARKQYDSLSLTYVQMTTAAVLFCAVSPLAGVPAWTVASRLSPGLWLVLLYLALIGTVFAFFVQMWAVRKTSPSRVSLLLGTEPIWALLVGVLLGGDRLGIHGAAGAALILVGAGWGQRIERKHREEKEKNGSAVVGSGTPERAEEGRPVAG